MDVVNLDEHRPRHGRQLVDTIMDELRKYVVLDSEHARLVVALWVIFTYTHEHARHAPILSLESPEPECGKSTMLTLLRALVRNGIRSDDPTPAWIYSRLDQQPRPTLLLDEADVTIDGNKLLVRILNSGWLYGGTVGRQVKGEALDFDVFGPKVVAGIGARESATLRSRSIRIVLHRRLATEHIELLPKEPDYRQLQEDIGAWAADHWTELHDAKPEMPATLYNRDANNFHPLLAIADLCGMAEAARNAAVAVTGDSRDADSDQDPGPLVLADMQRNFEELKCDRLSSVENHRRLVRMDDRPWAIWNNGRPITMQQIAGILSKRYGVRPRTMRIAGEPTKGYALDNRLSDVFARYVK